MTLQIQLTFGNGYVNTFKLVKPNECEKNFVDIFGENTDIPSRWVCSTYKFSNFLNKYSLRLIMFVTHYESEREREWKIPHFTLDVGVWSTVMLMGIREPFQTEA